MQCTSIYFSPMSLLSTEEHHNMVNEENKDNAFFHRATPDCFMSDEEYYNQIQDDLLSITEEAMMESL